MASHVFVHFDCDICIFPPIPADNTPMYCCRAAYVLLDTNEHLTTLRKWIGRPPEYLNSELSNMIHDLHQYKLEFVDETGFDTIVPVKECIIIKMEFNEDADTDTDTDGDM